MIMRTLVEQLSDRDLVLVDGVKVPKRTGGRCPPGPEEP